MTQISQDLPFRINTVHCADINLCHSGIFQRQTELKVIGHHTYVRPKLKAIGHFVRRPYNIYFKA
jgi:hypothetical protein